MKTLSCTCQHEFQTEYYGWRCAKCNLFYPNTAPLEAWLLGNAFEGPFAECPKCGTMLDFDGFCDECEAKRIERIKLDFDNALTPDEQEAEYERKNSHPL